MSSDGEKSAFNEGALQMQRIDMLQQRLNDLNIEPLAYNLHTQQYNFETIFRTINSLFSECSSKLSDKEHAEGQRIMRIINDMMVVMPPYNYVTNHNHGGAERVKQFNKKNCDMLLQMLFNYEIAIRAMLEEHNLTSPKMEAEGGWD